MMGLRSPVRACCPGMGSGHGQVTSLGGHDVHGPPGSHGKACWLCSDSEVVHEKISNAF